MKTADIVALLCMLMTSCGQSASTDSGGSSDAASMQEAGTFTDGGGLSDAASMQEAGTLRADGEETPYPDAAAAIDGGAMIVGPLNLFNNAYACLQFSLPLNAAGMVSCRVLLAGVTAGCAQDGLSPAQPADIAAIDAYGAAHPIGVPPAPVCEMKQLPPDVNCSIESVLGWCYFHGRCVADAGRMCAQEICTAADFASMFITDNHYSNFVDAWLVCP